MRHTAEIEGFVVAGDPDFDDDVMIFAGENEVSDYLREDSYAHLIEKWRENARDAADEKLVDDTMARIHGELDDIL